MEDINNRKFVGRLIFAVLTERKNVREAIKLFPESKDRNIECAYHALVHYAADEEMRYLDIEYKNRLKACKEINKKFGLNVTVKKVIDELSCDFIGQNKGVGLDNE